MPARWFSTHLRKSGWAHSQDRLSTLPAGHGFQPIQSVEGYELGAKIHPGSDAFTDDHIIDGSPKLVTVKPVSANQPVDIDFGFRFRGSKAEGYSLDFHYVDVSTFAAYVQAGGWWLTATGRGGDPWGGCHNPHHLVRPFAHLCRRYGCGRDLGSQDSMIHCCTWDLPPPSVSITPRPSRSSSPSWFRPRSALPKSEHFEMGVRSAGRPLSPVQTAEHAMLMYAKCNQRNSTSGYRNSGHRINNESQCRAGPMTPTERRKRATSALIQIAKIRIWGSHRRNTVSASVALNPTIDLNQTIDPGRARSACVRKMSAGCRIRFPRILGATISQFSLAICSISEQGYRIGYADRSPCRIIPRNQHTIRIAHSGLPRWTARIA